MYFDVGHSVVQHLNVSLDDRDLLRKTVVLADFPGQLLNFVFHHGIGTRVCDQYADQGHDTAEDGGNDAFHRRSPLPPAFRLAHIHMHPAVGASQTGRVDAAAASIAQQLVRVGIHLLHADALHLNVRRLAVQMLALSDSSLAETFAAYKEGLKKKIVKANEDLKEVKYEYKTN